MTSEALPDRVSALLRDHLRAEAAEGRITMLGSTGWAFDVLVPSDWKETVAATLEVGERSLRVEAFFLRAPEESGAPDRPAVGESACRRAGQDAVEQVGAPRGDHIPDRDEQRPHAG